MIRRVRITSFVFIFLLALASLLVVATMVKGDEGGNCSETGNHSVTSTVRVFATPADPMPDDEYEIIASVEVHENGSWHKVWNDTLGELVRKPDSPSPQVIDRQNGTDEGIRLFTSEPGTYRVWAGICRNDKSYWNFTNVTITPRNTEPVSIALLGTDNETSWTTNLTLLIDPGDEVTIFFNASLSHDPDGDELDYYWDIDNQSPFNDLVGPWVNWTFLERGSYPITLTVGDGAVTSENQVILNIHYSVFPDLSISSAPLLSLLEFNPGESVVVTTRIQNQGGDTSGPFEVHIYDHNLDNLKNRTIFIKEVEGLGIHEFHTLEFNWTTTNKAESGKHLLRVVLDLKDEVREENESNNQGWGSVFSVIPVEEYNAFITIFNMSLSNETLELFQMVNISLTVKNSGTGPAEWISVKLMVNGVEYDERYIPYLGPGDSITTLLFYSAALKGSYNLTCKVYDNGLFQDSKGQRIEVKDIEGTQVIDGNPPDPDNDSKDIDWLIMGAGIFMLIAAVAIQIAGRKAREK